VVLVRSRNPLNIGAVARAMSNFGFAHLRLVTPWEPSYLGARSAVDATEVLLNAQVYCSVAEAVADCSLVVGTSAIGEREWQHPLHALADGAKIIRQTLTEAPVALLFGSEKFGLSNDDLSHCHWLMRISMSDAHVSMNLGQAVAVCLYELIRRSAELTGTQQEHRSSRHAGAGELERITQVLFEALCQSGYVPALGETAALEKTRRLLLRMNLDDSDAVVLLGMMRQILWKTRHSQPDK